MRQIREWRAALAKGLRRNWPADASLDAAQLCDVELGLYLLSRVAPQERGDALPAFLQGTNFGWSASCAREIAVARHLLIGFRSPQIWQRALQKYAECPDNLRGFASGDDQIWREKPVSVEPQRFALYAQTLNSDVAHRSAETTWAQAGAHRFALGGVQVSADIPASLCFDAATPHPFAARPVNAPFHIGWSDLLETARWMDETETARGVPVGETAGRWRTRLERVQLRLRAAQGAAFDQAQQLDIEGCLHLAGMVSSGKSTLMEVLAVHAARQGRRVTLVLADVIDVLRRASLFERLGLAAAPILGASGRQSHLDRLHRFVASQQPNRGIEARHAAFRWVSTACALDGLRDNGSGVIPLDARPCTALVPADAPDGARRACPIYARCDFHRANLDARQALIWLATPASLVSTRVPDQLSENRVRWAEMVYRRSDLVIVDEADRVQMGLDAAFSPSEVLISRGEGAWMPKLQRRVTGQLNQNRGVLADVEVDSWCQSHGTLQGVAERLYGRLQRQSDVRRWLARRNYFTDRLLFDQIALHCSHADPQNEAKNPLYQALMDDFNACMDAPLGGAHALSDLARDVVLNNALPDSGARDWLNDHLPPSHQLEPDDARKWGQRLEVALLVTALQNQLAYVLKTWRSVEAPLQLDDGGNLLFQRPPDDTKPVLPLPPMGRELAFQYLAPDDNPNGAGDLRFFRCEAVGRALMLNFHKLWAAEGVAGPHTLLLSGTSWAGTSPSCHVQARVGGILRAPDAEIAAIENSQFRFWPLRYPAGDAKADQPIRISGLQGDDRERALRAMLHRLAVAPGAGLLSPLELQRDSLPASRRRVLLLTGSYQEAQTAYQWFTGQAPNRQRWEGKVRVLVPDTADRDADFDAGHLPRGLVDQFGGGDAWILIAPLLAIERGHNIINADGTAAIGAAYFLVRPHPRPDDIGYAIHSINRWAMDEANVYAQDSIGETARDFRRRGRIRWNRLIRHRLQWSALENADRAAVTWTQMVAIWQVIGRLVRGGQAAQVFFCDAAFAPGSAAGQSDNAISSLLISMRQVLRPYFDEDGEEAELVRTLYGPLWVALQNTLGLAENSDDDS